MTDYYKNLLYQIISALTVLLILFTLKNVDLLGYKRYSNLLFCVLTSNLFNLSIPQRMTYELSIAQPVEKLKDKYLTALLGYVVLVLPFLVVYLELKLHYFCVALVGILLNGMFTLGRTYSEGHRDFQKGRLLRLFQSILVYASPILLYVPATAVFILTLLLTFLLVSWHKPRINMKLPKKLLLINLLIISIGYLERNTVMGSAFASDMFFNIDLFSKQNIFLNSAVPLLLTNTTDFRYWDIKKTVILFGYVAIGMCLIWLISDSILTNNIVLELNLFIASMLIVLSGIFHTIILKNHEEWLIYIVGLLTILLFTYLASIVVSNEAIVLSRSIIQITVLIVIIWISGLENGKRFKNWLKNFVLR